MKVPHRALIFLALALPVPAMAEQLYLGYSYWDYKVSGQYAQSGSDYDLGSGFKASNSSRAIYRLRWDTGPGWWPDLAASYGRIEVNGQKNITTSTNIGPIPVQTNSTASAHTHVQDYDVTARWPWQFGWGRLSLGVTGKRLHGDIDVTDNLTGSAQTRASINVMFPMAHAFLEVPIGSRLRIGVGGDWAALDGDQADNIVAIVRLKVIGPLDLTGGWQSKHYKVHDDDYRLDTRLQGWQLGGELSF